MGSPLNEENSTKLVSGTKKKCVGSQIQTEIEHKGNTIACGIKLALRCIALHGKHGSKAHTACTNESIEIGRQIARHCAERQAIHLPTDSMLIAIDCNAWPGHASLAFLICTGCYGQHNKT